MNFIKRDFHEILHKFQNLEGGDVDAGQDNDLRINLQEQDLEEEDHADNAESSDADVQIENDAKAADLEDGGEMSTEVSILAECDKIAVVEEVCDDEADEGVETQPTNRAGAEGEHEEYPAVRIDENAGKENETESREDIRKMVDGKEEDKEDKEEDVVGKAEEECGEEKEEDNEVKGGGGETPREEEKPKEEENIEEEEEKSQEEEDEEGNKDDQEKEEQRKVYKSGWSSPLGNLAEQMFRNQEEMERAVDQTERFEENNNQASKKVNVKKEKKAVSMQQVVRAFSAVRNLKKIFR